MKKIPVILDTDLGTDIDDSWAIAYMLKCPELDVKLITTATGDTTYRAKLCARLLKAGGRTDVPIGIGIPLGAVKETLYDYANELDLPSAVSSGSNRAHYPGRVMQDGVRAMIETIMRSKEKVTLISIGPTPNIARALYVEPRIARKARFVGMQGSVRKGYNGLAGRVDEEYNVVAYAYDAARVFQAAWDMTVTPVDTCGVVRLAGEKFKKVLASKDPLTQELIKSYQRWSKGTVWEKQAKQTSSVLFDTVAIYLAFADKWLKLECIGIRTKWGFTLEDANAKKMNVATEWKSGGLNAFEEHLVKRLSDSLSPT
ncbi:MAG: nucleoside hydrolase [Candidatus Brocadiia bacterium]|jgi:inosine-uridine nucleoside N-ribohydrolase